MHHPAIQRGDSPQSQPPANQRRFASQQNCPPLDQNLRPRLKSEPELLVPGLECIMQANGTLLLQGAALQDPTVVAQIFGATRGIKLVK